MCAMVDRKSSSYFLKIKTHGKLPRFLDGLVQGIWFYFKKLYASLGDNAI
jgi:hypothetical protein